MVSLNGLQKHTNSGNKNRPFMTKSGRTVAGALLTLLEQHSAVPGTLSTRVYRAIRSAILDSTLRAGDRLPSTRALATDLSISRSTAEAAYAHLEDEGYLTRGVGSGSYVRCERPRAIEQPLHPCPGLPRHFQSAGGRSPTWADASMRVKYALFRQACRRWNPFRPTYGNVCWHGMRGTMRPAG
jgi:hypothetical protein